jgi:hypothetical protein
MSKVCPGCSALNRDEARFCRECSHAFSDRGVATRICDRGRHPMEPAWTACPYCAVDDSQARDVAHAPTTAPAEEGAERDATAPMTTVAGGDAVQAGNDNAQPDARESPAEDATIVERAPAAAPRPEPSPDPEAACERRIVAFLMTYSWYAVGQFFPLREGRTTIGRAADCDVSVPEDDQLADCHAFIEITDAGSWFSGPAGYPGDQADPPSGRVGLPDRARLTTGGTEWVFLVVAPRPNGAQRKAGR